jgi:hypothetical protein
MKPIREQVVVIVGASSGFGLLSAKEAARRGAKVVLAARNARDLECAVEEIRRDGGEAIAVPTDVMAYPQVEALACRAVEIYGRIDTWVSNAAESNERDIFVGGAGKALSLGERISPKLVDLQQLYQGFQGQKTDWPKSAEAPSNLYGPVEDDGGIRGDFSQRAHKRSWYQEIAAHPTASSLAAAAALGLGVLALRKADERGALPALLTLGALMLTGKSTLAATFEG